MIDLPREFFKCFNRFKKENMVKFCFYGGESCKKTCKAHSIQENGILNKIASDGKVITIDSSKKVGYHSVGIKQASTFSGFCSWHDREIFRPIERSTYQPGNKEQEFLFAYRALAKEYFYKIESSKIGKSIIENPDEIYRFFNNSNSEKEAQINFLKGNVLKENRDLLDYREDRQFFNQTLQNRDFDKIVTWTLVFDREYKIAVSDTFSIYHDRNHQLIYNVYHDMGRLHSLFFTIFPQAGKTFVIFSCDERARGKYDFIEKQIISEPIWIQKIIVSNIIAQYVKNFYLSPELVEKLDLVTKNNFLYYFQLTALGKMNLVFDKNLNLFFDY